MDNNPGCSASILIIGDGRLPAVERVRQALAQVHFKVQMIQPTPEDLAAAGRRYFDLIILDGDSVRSNCLDLYRRLKTDRKLGAVPVVVLNDGPIRKNLPSLGLAPPLGYLTTADLMQGRLWPIIEYIHYMVDRYG